MKNRLEKLIVQLQEGLIERNIPARLTLLAALAGEHILLIGPPGTAKSELARRLKLVFSEGSYFERLLTKFSVPEELFGPLSIKALEEDRYERLTHCYLPSASIAFIDEIFKANSAILNTLLTLLNEREFDNGNKRIKTPHREYNSKITSSQSSIKKKILDSLGPIILCIDTSASMHGKPEHIAKAVSLEVLRVANLQKRQCYLFAFSGPGQLVEKSLSLDQKGFKAVINFLRQTFHGGTDIREPINRAIKLVQLEQWRNADILLLTDGRFPVPSKTIEMIATEKQRSNLQIHGIIIGRWSTTNIKKICKPLYQFDNNVCSNPICD